MWKRFKAGTHAIELTKAGSESLERLADSVRRAFLLLGDWRNLVVDGLNSAVVGWQPFAYPVGMALSDVVGATITLPANGGAIAVPMLISGPMRITGLSFYSQDAAGARSMEWGLYQQLDSVPASNEKDAESALTVIGTFSVNPSAVGAKYSALTNSERVMPGLYWLVLRNTHAANTFGVGSVAYGTATISNTNMANTLATALGLSLDLSTASGWTVSVGGVPVVVLRGEVLGHGGVY